ncbi:Acetylglutamate kinase [Bienertia sinuspersici]
MDNKTFSIVFIYAPPNEEKKENFWQKLIYLVNNLITPYVIMGDFNEISTPYDKRGGSLINDYDTNLKVNHFIDENKKWKTKELAHLLPHWVVEDIKKLHIPHNQVEDKIIWAPSQSGEIGLKSFPKIATIWWFIWFARNKLVFNDEATKPEQIDLMFKTLQRNRSKLENSKSSNLNVVRSTQTHKQLCSTWHTWSPPPENFAKLNFDG